MHPATETRCIIDNNCIIQGSDNLLNNYMLFYTWLVRVNYFVSVAIQTHPLVNIQLMNMPRMLFCKHVLNTIILHIDEMCII